MPHPPRSRAQSAADFWARLDKTTKCWLWPGARQYKGYGRVWFLGRVWGTHRLAWYLTHGPIPARMQVCHACDNPPCCNPEHLFLGTNRANVTDMMRKGRWRAGNRHVGEAVHNAKLTAAAVREMRALHRAGHGYIELGARFGVTNVAARYAVTGRTWAHIEG